MTPSKEGVSRGVRNTGTIYSSTEHTPTILPEMAELLPPLTGEQLAALEADILKNGCYSPVIVNEDMVVIDGHNRQRLCEQHGLLYQLVGLDEKSRLVGGVLREGDGFEVARGGQLAALPGEGGAPLRRWRRPLARPARTAAPVRRPDAQHRNHIQQYGAHPQR